MMMVYIGTYSCFFFFSEIIERRVYENKFLPAIIDCTYIIIRHADGNRFLFRFVHLRCIYSENIDFGDRVNPEITAQKARGHKTILHREPYKYNNHL